MFAACWNLSYCIQFTLRQSLGIPTLLTAIIKSLQAHLFQIFRDGHEALAIFLFEMMEKVHLLICYR